MTDDQQYSCVYGLRMQARALSSMPAQTERHRFVVGSLRVKQENELHVLDFDEEEMEINSWLYRHSQEIWQISPCPSREDTLFTIHSQIVPEVGATQMATLWRLPTETWRDKSNSRKISMTMDPLLTIEATESPLRSILWEPCTEKSDSLLALDESSIRLLRLGEGYSTAQTTDTILGGKSQLKFGTAAWNPHHRQDVLTSTDTSLRGWDLRTPNTQTYVMEQAHGLCIRDADFNPNKPNILCSVGDDCKIRFWDLRNTKTFIKEISHHTHWIWSVQYNRFHDQLLLSAASDGQVCLHSAASVSSNPHGETSPSDASDDGEMRKPKSERLTDGVLMTVDQHEESVYAACWSAADPWAFASLSYDGRVVISLVPSHVKYKIIL